MNAAFATLLLRLCIAHVVADFFLQRKSWVEERRTNRGLRNAALWKHSLVHSAACALACLGAATPRSALAVAAVVLGTHAAIDAAKSALPRSTRIFLADQALHLAVLAVCALAVSGAGAAEVLGRAVSALSAPRTCAFILAYLLLSRPAGFFIEELTRPMRERIRDDDPPGLGNADFRIGILERWLTLTFLLIGSPGAIGFLIAATSIFRFGSLTGSGELRKTECILFGTMSGVFLALLVWIALDAALSALPNG